MYIKHYADFLGAKCNFVFLYESYKKFAQLGTINMTNTSCNCFCELGLKGREWMWGGHTSLFNGMKIC